MVGRGGPAAAAGRGRAPQRQRGPELLDQLAREGRYTGVVDTDPQDDLTEWTTTVVDRSGIARNGEEKTVSVQPLVSPELFSGGPVTITDDSE